MDISGEHLFNRVFNLLEDRNIKQKDFFAKVGVSKQAVARWKVGGFPSVEVLFSMSKELNVSIEWLLTGICYEDTYESWSPSEILKRIIARLEDFTGLKSYESGFYASIEHIVDKHELMDWAYGRRFVDIDKLCRIAERLGVSVQYLITGKTIDPEEYANYYGNKERKDEWFYKTIHCLNEEKTTLAKTLISNLFASQRQEESELKKSKDLENNI